MTLPASTTASQLEIGDQILLTDDLRERITRLDSTRVREILDWNPLAGTTGLAYASVSDVEAYDGITATLTLEEIDQVELPVDYALTRLIEEGPAPWE